jgi:RNA polymerase sigma-70 factor (ECF subfamily)
MTHDWWQITEEFGPVAWKAIFRLLRSHSESLDCYQDVMLEAFEHASGNSIENWAAYLRWLAVRRGLDCLRARKRSLLANGSPDVDQVVSRPEAQESIELSELKDRLRLELTRLPPQQAEAFWLRFVEQMSYVEIAEQMQVEASTVGVLIHRAKPRVQKSLSDLQSNRR